jgi:restriction system protein
MVGDLQMTTMWEIKIQHEGLHAYRNVKGQTKEEAETKARLQLEAWNARWAKQVQREKSLQDRLKKRNWEDKQSDLDKRAKEHALELTKDAETAISGLRELLSSALSKTNFFNWESLKDTSRFEKPEPKPPAIEPLPTKPLSTDSQFVAAPVIPRINIVDWIFPRVRRRKLTEASTEWENRKKDARQRFAQVNASWETQAKEIRERNQNGLENHEKAKIAWQLERKTFGEKQKIFNSGVDEFKKSYYERSPDALIRYWTELLSRSEYPDSFPRDQIVSFDREAGMLVVDYELPPQKSIPNTKHFKYVVNRKEFQEVAVSDAEFKRLYDEVLYQICLRTLFELFRADDVDVIRNIVFNGWVQAIDKATGANTHPCIMTVQANKAEFLALNLNQVDLKACFRSLKGISGSKLIDFSPVRPVLSLNREDPRFVGSYNVAESLNDKTNLAAMDWLDFENLIRELFEKEFSKNGGEVKITQASRDGGVDAIAFDPDPIRGGKIVIQAKRYTNTVGVAAVRDLFGTVHNEGATKGILVTTSDYGPDAYEFANGKPLTLLSGGELLYLLSKHGYQAKIDIQGAKKLLGETV